MANIYDCNFIIRILRLLKGNLPNGIYISSGNETTFEQNLNA